jgi:hypothetical protein
MPRDMLFSPTRELITNFWIVISKLLEAVVFFIIGWIIAKVLKLLIAKLLKIIRVDYLVEESGLKEILVRGHVTKEPSELIANIVYWLLIIVFLSIALNLTGISIPQDVIETLLSFIPRIIVGLVIFILSLFVGNIFEGVINTTAANAGLEKPYIFGRMARIAVIIFGIVLTLQEIGIGTGFVTTSFDIVLASISFAFAIAFGLGAKDFIKEWLESNFKKKQ